LALVLKRIGDIEMKDDIWFEETLVPPATLADETAQGLKSVDEQYLIEEQGLDIERLRQAPDKGPVLEQFVREQAQGILRVHTPRWRPLTEEEAGALPTGLGDIKAGAIAEGNLYLTRLGLEFDVLPEGRKGGWSYSAAWCRAYLFSPGSTAQPRVLEIYPQRLYEGEPRTVKVEVGLGLKVEPVEVELGKVGTDLHIGQVTPVTVGFFGDEERSPYWELRAREKPILGVYHFWMIAEQPPECGPVRLAVLGEGDLQTRLFNIPVGPKERAWENRESIPLVAAE
jgi:hypothetical protein